ncbi:MAG: urea carboxylase [Halieaceae bacterium]|jgi:urea carboxylase|nr:urea carboxylase [Halieaceae bacterium]
MSNDCRNVSRVLIANRGAIAVRIARTLRKMGVAAIAVYAESDRDSLHVRCADEAFSLGDGAARDTYLDQEKILDIAQRAGADAIHPGYGFLSENTAFVERCAKRELVFLGPTAAQIDAFGLKHRARALAEKQKVPLLPGTGVLSGPEEALVEAEKIGYPVILKSTAGGGGIGMQLCATPEELAKAFASVAQLSANNFSNPDLFLEKFVARARHIEVQVFGDGRGNAIVLGERDCSAQRRNQKVIEETPAPNLSDELRERLAEVALRLLRAVDYRSAGTVEFIYDAESGEFYFLEVNTRLQVEHGVTEMVYAVDIVEWMVRLADGSLESLDELARGLRSRGHAIQARVYAEDASRNFQPSAGLLSHVSFPPEHESLRIDHWIESGIEVSPFYDPMLAKVIVWADNRENALTRLSEGLAQTSIYGIETNLGYLQALLASRPMQIGEYFTNTLSDFAYARHAVEVLAPGTMTTVQDYPGRVGFWHVGVPPSGPFDNLSFRLGNRVLGNPAGASGLELTLDGPTLRFLSDTSIALAGAEMPAALDGSPIPFWRAIHVRSGQTLKIGKLQNAGARAYLLIAGGIDCPEYLGAKATFTLGRFGGHAGRALRTGDVLHLAKEASRAARPVDLPPPLRPEIGSDWVLHVIPGPHAAPEFFSSEYIEGFFDHAWEVHYNSSRTGVRLLGPKPDWSRSSGGDAGMHPSNIHDNAYAFGTVDFTGDMPVILGPDGPSLGGFVCPATVITADLWKIGQLAAGHRVRFVAVTRDSAVAELARRQREIDNLDEAPAQLVATRNYAPEVTRLRLDQRDVAIRRSGDSWLLVEFGDMVLDIELRFLAHRLMLGLEDANTPGVQELTPGIRSLQIHFDPQIISDAHLIDLVQRLVEQLASSEDVTVPSRIVRLPLSWDDDECRRAIQKYDQVVRKDAPWYPSNIDFIRRINGLESEEDVRRIVFEARYLVMGLGDVYLGAPVATPVDPRHRLVTTKYNPARTWTAENSVGIGGSYLCIYGMEGPGGYQFVGRTLQMWNRYRQTAQFSEPWLLRFFDQIQFFPVSGDELASLRDRFPVGSYAVDIEETRFSLAEYRTLLRENAEAIGRFKREQERAFDEELERWKESGQFSFEEQAPDPEADEETVPEGVQVVDSPVAGSVWKLEVHEGADVLEGQTLLILESMKMEIEVRAPCAGRVNRTLKSTGSLVHAGAPLVFLETDL